MNFARTLFLLTAGNLRITIDLIVVEMSDLKVEPSSPISSYLSSGEKYPLQNRFTKKQQDNDPDSSEYSQVQEDVAAVFTPSDDLTRGVDGVYRKKEPGEV